MPGAKYLRGIAHFGRSAWRRRSLVLLILLGALLAWSAYLYETGVFILERDSKRLAAVARQAIAEPKIDDAVLLALEALPPSKWRMALGRGWSPEAEAALADALNVGLGVRRMRRGDTDGSSQVAFPSADRLVQFGDRPVIFDARTGKESQKGQPSPELLSRIDSSSAVVSADQRYAAFAVDRSGGDPDAASEAAAASYCVVATESFEPVAHVETGSGDHLNLVALHARADGTGGRLLAIVDEESLVLSEWRGPGDLAACGKAAVQGAEPAPAPASAEAAAPRPDPDQRAIQATLTPLADLTEDIERISFAKDLSTVVMAGGQKAYFWGAAAPAEGPATARASVSPDAAAPPPPGAGQGAFEEIALGLEAGARIQDAAVSDDGRMIALGVTGGRIIFVTPNKSSVEFEPKVYQIGDSRSRISTLAFGESKAWNRTVLFAHMVNGGEAITKVVDAKAPATLRSLKHGRRSVGAGYAYDSASEQLAVSLSGGVVQVWEPFRAKLAHEARLSRSLGRANLVWRPGGDDLAMTFGRTGSHAYVLRRDEFKPVRSYQHALGDPEKPNPVLIQNYDLAAVRGAAGSLFAVAYIAASPGFRELQSGVAVYDPRTGESERLPVPVDEPVQKFTFFGRLASAEGGAVLFAGAQEDDFGAVHVWRGEGGKFLHAGKELTARAVMFLSASPSGRWLLAVDFENNAVLYDAEKVAKGATLDSAGQRAALRPCASHDGVDLPVGNYFVAEKPSDDGLEPVVAALCRNGDVAIFDWKLKLVKSFPSRGGDYVGAARSFFVLHVLERNSLRAISLLTPTPSEAVHPHDFADPKGVWAIEGRAWVAADGALWARARTPAHAELPYAASSEGGNGGDDESQEVAPAPPTDALTMPAAPDGGAGADRENHPGWERIWAPTLVTAFGIDALEDALWPSGRAKEDSPSFISAAGSALVVWRAPAKVETTGEEPNGGQENRQDDVYMAPSLGGFPIREPLAGVEPPMRWMEFGVGQLDGGAAHKLTFDLHKDKDGNARLFVATVLETGEIGFFEPAPFGFRLREVAEQALAKVERGAFTEEEVETYGVKGHRDFPQWFADGSRKAFREVRAGIGDLWSGLAYLMAYSKPDSTQHTKDTDESR